MSDPFLGEVQVFGFGFAPRGWALAGGQALSIPQSSALYALYGTTFGGNGTTHFCLPNLASRYGCGAGQSPGNSDRDMGETFGTPGVSLTQTQMPAHNHGFSAYPTADENELVVVPTVATAIGNVNGGAFSAFAAPGPSTAMNASALGSSGNGSPHENRQPFLGLTYAVALSGVFPSFG